MQELRLVLIIVGGLAILALLIHGLWSSKKESKPKFGSAGPDADIPQGDDRFGDDGFEVVKKTKGEPSFGAKRAFDNDPLVSGTEFAEHSDPLMVDKDEDADDDVIVPSIRNEVVTSEEDEVIFSNGDEMISKKRKVTLSPKPEVEAQTEEVLFAEVSEELTEPVESEMTEQAEEPVSEPEVVEEEQMEVIVLNVHTANNEPFVGTKLFDSMEQNGLKYGEMDIFHRHSDLSGAGKVLFSVANMMRPGTLKHDDPATFTTKGISFFMTLPCYGDAEQNFKLMLRTAQQIADDLGANVLDEKRNLMTPNKLEEFRTTIRAFKART